MKTLITITIIGWFTLCTAQTPSEIANIRYLDSQAAQASANYYQAQRKVFLNVWNNNYTTRQKFLVANFEDIQSKWFAEYSQNIGADYDNVTKVMQALGANENERFFVGQMMNRVRFSYETSVLVGFHEFSPRKYDMDREISMFCLNYYTSNSINLSPRNSQHINFVANQVNAKEHELYFVQLSMYNSWFFNNFSEKILKEDQQNMQEAEDMLKYYEKKYLNISE